jgi:hypothetical protein
MLILIRISGLGTYEANPRCRSISNQKEEGVPVGLLAELCNGVALLHLAHSPSSPLLLGTVHGGGQRPDILHWRRFYQLHVDI